MYRIYSDFRYVVKIGLCRIYYLNGLAFTFDEIQNPDSQTIDLANQNSWCTMDEIYRSSSYLIQELCHQIIFELDAHLIHCEEEIPY